MKWTTREIAYLEEHASDGATSIAAALGRSVKSVEVQASRYGLSLRKSWLCPKCGLRVFSPLSTTTGWCSTCTKAAQNMRMAEQVRDLQEEARREKQVNKERQKLYSAKYRAKKKIQSFE